MSTADSSGMRRVINTVWKGVVPRHGRALLLAALVVALVAAPAPAAAHLMETGFGGYYDGLVHLLLTPADLLLVLALSLWAVQQGAATCRQALAVVPGAWLLGGWIGLGLPETGAMRLVATLGFMLAGLAVALRIRLPRPVWLIAAGCLGLLQGSSNGATMSHAGGLLAVAGAVSGVAGILAILCGQLLQIQRPWLVIGQRVLGSWIAAAGLLMLGWTLRG
ncbi:MULTISPECIES: HupE/UreJ family protein [Aphanothece]|uniref:HupE/UreJ family protein n=1 Tax=Aphanothece TaxID=1121 RepID=UPI00398F42E8